MRAASRLDLQAPPEAAPLPAAPPASFEGIQLGPGTAHVPAELLETPIENDRRRVMDDLAAFLLDRHLRRLVTMRNPLELRLARLLGRFEKSSGHLELGFARMSDYVTERLGISVRPFAGLRRGVRPARLGASRRGVARRPPRFCPRRPGRQSTSARPEDALPRGVATGAGLGAGTPAVHVLATGPASRPRVPVVRTLMQRASRPGDSTGPTAHRPRPPAARPPRIGGGVQTRGDLVGEGRGRCVRRRHRLGA